MHPSVESKWHKVSEPLEGRVHSMYVDIKGLITTAVGNLIDTVQAALKLPWKHEATGELASRDEVAAAWRDLKSQAAHYAKLHWKYAAKLNDLRLTDADIDALVLRVLREFETHLVAHHFPQFATYPADAQLAILSMAWALGPGFPVKFGNFKRAVLASDWAGAAASCKIREEGNPGIVPRNALNRMLLANAEIVKDLGLDPSELHWPEVASAPVGQPGAVYELHEKALGAKLAAESVLDDFVRSEFERIRVDSQYYGARALQAYEDAEAEEGESGTS